MNKQLQSIYWLHVLPSHNIPYTYDIFTHILFHKYTKNSRRLKHRQFIALARVINTHARVFKQFLRSLFPSVLEVHQSLTQNCIYFLQSYMQLQIDLSFIWHIDKRSPCLFVWVLKFNVHILPLRKTI